MEMKCCWFLPTLLLVMVALTWAVNPDEPDSTMVRRERGANSKETCRYSRGPWSDCDPKTNARSRTLTLKKGDPNLCDSSRTIQKKCKKGNKPTCRYEKSPWSECNPIGEMTRSDMLKVNSDPSCERVRLITKKCNKNKRVKSKKDNGQRTRQ